MECEKAWYIFLSKIPMHVCVCEMLIHSIVSATNWKMSVTRKHINHINLKNGMKDEKKKQIEEKHLYDLHACWFHGSSWEKKKRIAINCHSSEDLRTFFPLNDSNRFFFSSSLNWFSKQDNEYARPSRLLRFLQNSSFTSSFQNPFTIVYSKFQ